MFFAMSQNLLDNGFLLYIQPAHGIIVNRYAWAGYFAVLHVVAALPNDLLAAAAAVPSPPPQRRAALAADKHAGKRIAVRVCRIFPCHIAFGCCAKRNLPLRFLPYVAADNRRMVVRNVEAFDFAIIPAFLFA